MVNQPRTLAELLKMLHEQQLPRRVLDEVVELESSRNRRPRRP